MHLRGRAVRAGAAMQGALHSVAAKMLLSLLAAASAKPPQCGDPGVGPVLGGIDLVEASTLAGQNVSVPHGSEMHGVNAFGYRFLFVSEANAVAFQSNPAAHVPRFGGYCGIAMTGHDDCCAPLPACLGPTCIHLDQRYTAPPPPPPPSPLPSGQHLSTFWNLLHLFTHIPLFRACQLRPVCGRPRLFLLAGSQTLLGPRRGCKPQRGQRELVCADEASECHGERWCGPMLQHRLSMVPPSRTFAAAAVSAVWHKLDRSDVDVECGAFK